MATTNIMQSNPFAGVQLTGATELLGAAKINPYESFLRNAGGMLKEYETTQEANKLALFNNTLLDMQNKGDISGLQQLANVSDQFKDATVKQKAFADARTAFDTTGSTVLLNKLEKAKQEQDLPAYQALMQEASTAGFSPTTLGKVQTKFGTDLPELKVIGATKEVTDSALSSFNSINQNNNAVYGELYAANPELAKTHDLINGQLLPKAFDQNAFAADIIAKNKGVAPPDLQAQVSLAAQTFAVNQDTAEKSFYTTAAGKKDSLKDVGLYADKAGKELTQKLVDLGIPLEKASASGAALAAQLLNKQKLGVQGQEALSKTMATDIAAANTKKLELKEQYAVTKQFNDAEIQQIIEQKKFGVDDLFKRLSEIDPSGNWTSPTQNNRTAITTKAQELLNTEIDLGNGVKRKPTMFEVANAIQLSKDSPWWTSIIGNRVTANTSDILPNVKLAMQNNGAFNKTPITEDIFKSINNYVKENAKVDAALAEKSLRVTRRLNAESGIPDASYNTEQMQKAIARSVQSTPAVTTNTDTNPYSAINNPIVKATLTAKTEDEAKVANANLTKAINTGEYRIPPPEGSFKPSSEVVQRITYLNSELIKAGFTPKQAAGQIGSLMQESGLDPAIKNKEGSGAFGIAQWIGTRKQDLLDFTKKTKVEDTTFEEQVAFKIYELKNGKEKSAGQEILKKDDIAYAANIHAQKYERMGQKEAGIQKRIQNGVNIYEYLNKEIPGSTPESVDKLNAQTPEMEASIAAKNKADKEAKQAEANLKAAKPSTTAATGSALTNQIATELETKIKADSANNRTPKDEISSNRKLIAGYVRKLQEEIDKTPVNRNQKTQAYSKKTDPNLLSLSEELKALWATDKPDLNKFDALIKKYKTPQVS